MEEAYHALSYAPLYLPLHVEMAEVLISEGRIMQNIISADAGRGQCDSHESDSFSDQTGFQ